MSDWIYNEAFNTWMYGTSNCGCGVYNDGNGWEGNVVTNLRIILGVGPLSTKEEAMAECLKNLERIIAESN